MNEVRETQLRNLAQRWAEAQAKLTELSKQRTQLEDEVNEQQRLRNECEKSLSEFVGRNQPRKLVRLEGLNVAVLVQHRPILGSHVDAVDVHLETIW